MTGLLGTLPVFTAGLLGQVQPEKEPHYVGLFGYLAQTSTPDGQYVPEGLFTRNIPAAKPGPYLTQLPPDQERGFRLWVQKNNIPVDPDDPRAAYDMRGYYQGLLQNDPRAATQINGIDHKRHFNDKWKTPYDKSFSNDSQYALPTAPFWANDAQLVDPNTGLIVFDERQR